MFVDCEYAPDTGVLGGNEECCVSIVARLVEEPFRLSKCPDTAVVTYWNNFYLSVNYCLLKE